MRKTLVIAVREYLAAVRTKSFIVGLLMMPVLMGSGVVIQMVFQKMEDTGEKRFAVVDRTPGQKLAAALQAAAEARNNTEIFDPATHKQAKPRFVVDRIEPSADTPEARIEQRIAFSDEVLQGKYFGFLEIGSEVYRSRPGTASIARPNGDLLADDLRLRYQSRTPQYTAFSRWAETILNEAIEAKRWVDAKQSREKIAAIQQPVPLVNKGLTRRDARSGGTEDTQTSDQEAHLLVPIALVLVMFMMIMIGATPLVASVLEEKNQRIAEVLLGSVQPFQLMMGKLVGMVGVSLTIVAVYLAGGYYGAYHYGLSSLLTGPLIAWFLLFLVLAVMMYGSIFIAVGAACTTSSETQTMLMPVILIAVLPMMVIVRIVQEPNSAFATGASFFPPATPMLMLARLAVPPGVPWWQPLAGIGVVLLATIGCVYAAGRILRVGLLMSGKGARIGDLVKWVVSG
jgi:ABC-2 type transport system permease protein